MEKGVNRRFQLGTDGPGRSDELSVVVLGGVERQAQLVEEESVRGA